MRNCTPLFRSTAICLNKCYDALHLLARFILLIPISAASALDINLSDLHVDGGYAYMGMGGAGSIAPFFLDDMRPSAAAKTLWESKKKPDYVDSYKQPWRRFPLENFESIIGPIQRHVLIVRVVEEPSTDKARCSVEPDSRGYVSVIENCSQPVSDLQFEYRKVTQGLLIQWGCDDAILPAVDLGPTPKGENGYEGSQLFAFSANIPIPLPKHQKVTEPQLPDSVKKKFAINYDAWRLDFGDGVERWIIYFSDFMAGPYLRLIEHPRDDKKRKVIDSFEVYGRC